MRAIQAMLGNAAMGETPNAQFLRENTARKAPQLSSRRSR